MPKVLVVDDNENIVREATTYLELEGWEASGASNGKEALDCLTTEFDAVVLDLKMPVLDGENTLTEIRRRSELDATCVVILTAYGEVKGAMRAVRLGAYQYIEKPFEMQDLHKILAGGVALQKAHALRRELLTAFQPDDLFEHDGQITKRDVRAVTLSALEPRRGELLWDIGAGSGSVAIEWMLLDPLMRAIAIEQREDRAARIRRNAALCGVPALEVAEGMAPTALTTLAPPDAIFIGGGADNGGTFDVAVRALRPGGRLVANAVTLETEALLLARHAALGGELVRIAISRAEPLGGKTGWRPAMPITQWRWTKT